MPDDNEERDSSSALSDAVDARQEKAASDTRLERDRAGNPLAGAKSPHRTNNHRDRRAADEPESSSAVTSSFRSDLPEGPPPSGPSGAGERISKVISRAGVASRRDVERMIAEGRIALNGETVMTPVLLVKPSDRILVDGAPLPVKERTRLFLYHKPPGLVTTEKDPEGRDTVFAALPEGLPRLVSVGRLDLNTEGLLLLTNDGGLARLLAHPKTGWLRRYRVRAFGEITQGELDRLKDGIEIDGMHYGPVEAKVDREQGANMWLTLGLREGKNREVKRILEHFGLKVNRLIRISFGPFQLGELEQGAVEEVRTRTLKDQLAPELAREAKLDFATEPQEAKRPAREFRREAPLVPPHREPGRRAAFDGHSGKAGEEARASRKAEAIAQGRRSAAQRHSWRDAESWAVRGERRKNAAGNAMKRPPRPPHGGAPPGPDERPHFRGGRIADRKGRSVLVERIAPDPAAATTRESAGPKRPSPARDTDVLRRKTRREQGLEPPRNETGAGPALGQTRAQAWKARQRPFAGLDRRLGDEREPRRVRAEPGPRRASERPWRRSEGRGDRPSRPAGEDFKPRGERPGGSRPHREGFKPRSDGRVEGGEGMKRGRFRTRDERPAGFRPRCENAERFKPRGERGEDFKAGGKRPGNFRPRGEGFKPRGLGPRPPRPGGTRDGPPKGRPGRPPRKPHR